MRYWWWMSAMIGIGERGTICARPCRLLFVAGAAHDVAARGGERVDLLEGALDIRSLRRGHGLHRDGCAAAHGDLADGDLAGGATLEHRHQVWQETDPNQPMGRVMSR